MDEREEGEEQQGGLTGEVMPNANLPVSGSLWGTGWGIRWPMGPEIQHSTMTGKRVAGEPGFEPGLTESESAGLPLTYSPIL